MYIKTIAADIIILHTIFVLPYRFTSRQSVPKYFTNNIFLAILNYESLPKYFTYNICIATSIYIKTISAEIFYKQYFSCHIKLRVAAEILYLQYLYCHIDLHQDNQCRHILHTIFVFPDYFTLQNI